MSLKSTLMGALAAFILATPAIAEIEIHHPYARSSNAMAGAAFMVIHNLGDSDDRLIDVRSDVAARTELHTHNEDENGVMRMVHVKEGMEIPAGSEIILKRGGKHVMFMGLNAAFVQDDILTITLVFEQAGDVVVEIPVDQDREDTMDHSTMDYSDMDHSDHDPSDHDS